MTATDTAWAQDHQAKLDRIAIMSADFDSILKVGAGAPPDPSRTLDLMDLPQAERTAGLRALYPLSSGITHCTNDSSYKLADALRIAKDAGYKGLYSIQTASGAGADPYAAAKALLDEWLKEM